MMRDMQVCFEYAKRLDTDEVMEVGNTPGLTIEKKKAQKALACLQDVLKKRPRSKGINPIGDLINKINNLG